jgi:outer membrane protein OmpA-like peptidoglycan-associated protein
MTRQSLRQVHGLASPFTLVQSGLLQRKCSACDMLGSRAGTCPTCAKDSKAVSLQRKLAIGATNDPLEAEADRVADQVTANMPVKGIGAAATQIQRRSSHATGSVDGVPDSVHEALGNGGAALDHGIRRHMEARFGHDFSQVRVHNDASASRSARDIGASAYTVGNDIVFGKGAFAPGSQTGQHLLAHELAHVVQQEAMQSEGQIVQRHPLGAGGFQEDRDASLTYESFRQSITLAGFVSDSAELTPEHVEALKEYKQRLFGLLGRYPDSFITVVGHTDATDSEKHNQKLGQDRADAVIKELTSGDNAVSASLLSAHSLGETSLAVDTKQREPRNRRVEIMPTLRRNFNLGLLTPPEAFPGPGQGFNFKPDLNIGPRLTPPITFDPTPRPIPFLNIPQRNWLEEALKKDKLVNSLPDFARDGVISALKDGDEKLAEKIIDALPLEAEAKQAVQAIVKSLLQLAKGKKFEPTGNDPNNPATQPLPTFPKMPGQVIIPLKTWEF